jgi:prepilin-type N-terminal cleavage/methylation domain-containing protein
MKLTNTQSMKAKSGMTLLELTVVILVLLSLISILFIGARAWKKGSDRSANIMNVRNAQQALRGHQNTRGFKATDTVTLADIIGEKGYLKEQKVPVEGTDIPTEYEYAEVYGEPGDIFVLNADLGGTDGEYFYSAAEITEKTSDW